MHNLCFTFSWRISGQDLCCSRLEIPHYS